VSILSDKCLGSALSFDDVMLVPQYSEVPSREEGVIDLTTNLTKTIKIKHPVIPTNMDTITETAMMLALNSTGGVAFCHRFMSDDRFLEIAKEVHGQIKPSVLSVGVKDDDYLMVRRLAAYECLPDAILIDIAHGDSKMVMDMIKFIKGFKVQVIAGNVATGEGYLRLVDAGADCVRVGISGGSVCTTKYVTGHGLPTLASVISCSTARSAHGLNVPFIADGGIRNSGDIVKALAFGADAVCAGRIFAGSSETPQAKNNSGTMEYYGMSSEIAQQRHRNGLRRSIASEGICVSIDAAESKPTSDILDKILGGVRSGLTYSGAFNIEQLRQNFEYVTLEAGSFIQKNNNWGN
jgi:IMP dehydrogenase